MYFVQLCSSFFDWKFYEESGLCGAPARSRTADLLITNQLLYQLSYKGFCFRSQFLVQ
jgi:hypothetical protein